MGRSKIQIDTIEVEKLSGHGLTNKEICLTLGIDERTFYRRKRDTVSFDVAIKKGRAVAKMEIANVLFGLAMGGNLTALIWIEKTRFGYSDRILIRKEEEVETEIELTPAKLIYLKKLIDKELGLKLAKIPYS